MSKATKGAILSLRLSEGEQMALRGLAESRGTSVSDVIRSIVAREVAPPQAPIATSSAASRPAVIGQGVFWRTSEEPSRSGTISTSTMTR